MPTADCDRNNSSSTGQVFTYFSSLTLLYYLAVPTGYLVDIVTAYMLKNQLHASATQVSLFRLLTAIPVYLSFVFGMTRDLWNPLRMRDRGYFLLFGFASAIVFIWMAFSGLSYAGLFIGLLLLMITFRFVGAAYQGLMALVGQEKLMSGRLSALWQIIMSVPYVLGGFAAGYITEHVPYRRTFTILAVLSLLIAAFGFWKPRSVFGGAY